MMTDSETSGLRISRVAQQGLFVLPSFDGRGPGIEEDGITQRGSQASESDTRSKGVFRLSQGMLAMLMLLCRPASMGAG